MSAFMMGFAGTGEDFLIGDLKAQREEERYSKRLSLIDKLDQEREARLRKHTKADERIGRDPKTGQMFKEILNQDGEVIGRRLMTDLEAEQVTFAQRGTKADVESKEAGAKTAGVESRFAERFARSKLSSEAQNRDHLGALSFQATQYAQQAAEQAEAQRLENEAIGSLSLEERLLFGLGGSKVKTPTPMSEQNVETNITDTYKRIQTTATPDVLLDADPAARAELESLLKDVEMTRTAQVFKTEKERLEAMKLLETAINQRVRQLGAGPIR